MRRLATPRAWSWVVAALVSACSGTQSPSSTTTPPTSVTAPKPSIDIPSRGGFGRLGVGEPASLEPPRFVADGRRGGGYRLSGETARVGGVELPDAHFRLGDDGRLSTVTLAASVSDPDKIGPLQELASEVCVGLGTQLEIHIPSPLGTPEPGEDWDPVITETGTCEAEVDGVHVRVRSEHNSASDFARQDLTITVTPKR